MNDNISPQLTAETASVKPPSEQSARDWKQMECNDIHVFREKMEQFLELRAKGFSLRKISEQIGVPKSTLYDWNIRNARILECLRRVELEAVEERLIGSHEEQITELIQTLKRLEKAFSRKLREAEDDLSPTELFWMAANLRQQLSRLRVPPLVTDSPDPYRHPYVDPFTLVGTRRTNPDKTTPPIPPCP